jgi:hypothetical protein
LQKQIGLAIIAAILVVGIGLSVGLPLGFKSAGIVGIVGWDKAIDTTIAELSKDKPNAAVKYTKTITYLDKGVLKEGSYAVEFYADGDKYKSVVDGEISYAVKENGKWYTYIYNKELDKFEKTEGGNNDLKDKAQSSDLRFYKRSRALFKHQDGKYVIKDIDKFQDILNVSNPTDFRYTAFTISFKNGRIEAFYKEFQQGDSKYTESMSYTFGGVEVTLPNI